MYILPYSYSAPNYIKCCANMRSHHYLRSIAIPNVDITSLYQHYTLHIFISGYVLICGPTTTCGPMQKYQMYILLTMLQR